MFDSLTLGTNIVKLLEMMLDIGIMAVVIYFCLKIVKNNSRTIQIFKGILFVILTNGAAQLLNLRTVEWLTDQCLTWGFLALIIIFQPEIRSLLEKMGKTVVFSRITTLSVNEREHLVNELVKTCMQLSKTKTGALISIEQSQSLSDFIRTGTAMNSVVSSELLCSIFQYGTPLHDGAVIIQGDKIACASAYFPPTAKEFSSNYGARHRAAVGISEINDCVTIVVSEETGKISIAREGTLIQMNERELKEYLQMALYQTSTVAKSNEVEGIIASAEKKETVAENKDSKLKINFITKKKHRYEKKKISEEERKRSALLREKRQERIEAEEIVIPDHMKQREGSDS